MKNHQKNLWTRERLESFIGQEESTQLEFKSSIPLNSSKDSDITKFFSDKLSPAVSAFINTEGGTIIVGLEEERSNNDRDVVKCLSKGVPRSIMSGIIFENKLLDRVHPATGSFVRVHTVKVGENEAGDLLAFVVVVQPGVTAYQATDKKYYCRRGYSNAPMDDKDIRLRMLTDDRPRVSIKLSKPIFQINGGLGYTIEKLKTEIPSDLEVINKNRAVREELGEELWRQKLNRKLEAGAGLIRTSDWRYLRDKSVTVRIVVEIENSGNVSIHRGAIKTRLVKHEAPNTVNWLSRWNQANGEDPIAMFEPFEFGGQVSNSIDVEEWKIPLYPGMRREITSVSLTFDRFTNFAATLDVINVTVYLDSGTPAEMAISIADLVSAEYLSFEEQVGSLTRDFGLDQPI